MTQFKSNKCVDFMIFLYSELPKALIKGVPNIATALQPERIVFY